jgi:hypothetical protein
MHPKGIKMCLCGGIYLCHNLRWVFIDFQICLYIKQVGYYENVIFMQATKTKPEKESDKRVGEGRRRLRVSEWAQKVGWESKSEEFKRRAAERFYEADTKNGYRSAADIFFRLGTKDAKEFTRRLLTHASVEIGKGDFKSSVEKVEVAVEMYASLFKIGEVGDTDMNGISAYLAYAYSKRADRIFGDDTKGNRTINELFKAAAEYEQALRIVPELMKRYKFSEAPYSLRMHLDYEVFGHVRTTLAEIYRGITKSGL